MEHVQNDILYFLQNYTTTDEVAIKAFAEHLRRHGFSVAPFCPPTTSTAYFGYKALFILGLRVIASRMLASGAPVPGGDAEGVCSFALRFDGTAVEAAQQLGKAPSPVPVDWYIYTEKNAMVSPLISRYDHRNHPEWTLWANQHLDTRFEVIIDRNGEIVSKVDQNDKEPIEIARVMLADIPMEEREDRYKFWAFARETTLTETQDWHIDTRGLRRGILYVNTRHTTAFGLRENRRIDGRDDPMDPDFRVDMPFVDAGDLVTWNNRFYLDHDHIVVHQGVVSDEKRVLYHFFLDTFVV